MHAVPNPRPDVIDTLTFANALHLAELVGDGAPPGQCHAIVVADHRNEIVRKVVLEGVFTLDHAVGWTIGFHDGNEVATALLISVVDRPVECIDPIPLYEFDYVRTILRLLGLELRDWLLDDRCMMRSMAYTVKPESAWLSDPTPARTVRLRLSDPGLIEDHHDDVP